MKIRIAQEIRKAVRKAPRKPQDPSSVYLSTGSTLLNLAISNRIRGGFLQGHYYFLVGDSASGKSFLSMTCFAEAVINPSFHKHRLIYDNAEDGMLMDVRRLFGSKVEKRLEHKASETIDDLYYSLDDLVEEGEPFIYVLDSMDGLDAQEDVDTFSAQKTAHRKGTDGPRSYGTAKAKKNSTSLRRVIAGLRKTGSILIVISQTRVNINASPWQSKKTRGGGEALRFYATVELWSSQAGVIKKTIRGKPRIIGNVISLKVAKNRITGELQEVQTVIYPSFGIDDVGSCVDFLLHEKWWTKKGKMIHAKELKTSGTRDQIIHLCETKRKTMLRAMSRCWKSIAQEKRIDRRTRYE